MRTSWLGGTRLLRSWWSGRIRWSDTQSGDVNIHSAGDAKGAPPWPSKGSTWRARSSRPYERRMLLEGRCRREGRTVDDDDASCSGRLDRVG